MFQAQVSRLLLPNSEIYRNFFLGGAVVYGCYAAYTTVVLSPVARWVEDEEEKLTAEERKALEEGTDATAFIAFPLTTHAVQPPPYSGRDPEWLEFVKLSKNKPLQQKIRGGWFIARYSPSLQGLIRALQMILRSRCGRLPKPAFPSR